ncbi:threonine-phosphate decarboxylase [Sphingobium phenoxybenzoativorans]|uniref:threonine-phosphate decarboxylase n=1 Tax=Sphingobium phenoxybenzoativorans TaxID=1592790 RepID=A0A975Q3E1_9SPHN|nr:MULTISPECIES: threonine-phosphate decarboxylase CobD [Sphingobium]MEA3388444.1 threonine-phosphate decarboxylase CobD [Pseudomonadota bacterium]QUT07646.1 threonine-phosphate decarboxylase [Sphingobium phenoxybenzoativorans]
MNSFSFHGGRLADAMAQFGMANAPWIDLSTGINPHGWPGADNLAVDWQALPDAGALNDLEAAAAACFGADPAHVCAVPGTEIGLRMLGDILSGAAIHAQPSYRTHGEMIPRSRPVALTELAGTEEATLILANPNNPDGRIMPPATLIGWLEARRDSAAWLVVDEAFADATPHSSLAAHVQDEQRLIIFRSFGKFFGLAGVRLGFVLGPRGVIAQYRQRLGSWPLSAAALAIGPAAYRDADWIAAMRVALREQAHALDAVLARRGFSAVGDCPLFRLIETADAAALFERLARHAILTRPFDYDPRWLRLGLPADREALDRLDAALADD